MSRIIHNLKLLGISLVFSISIAYIIRHPELLMSSVLNIQEISEVRQNHRDIAYKTTKNIFDVFLAWSWTYIGPLDIIVSHDPETIVHIDQLTGQLPYKTLESGSWFVRISFVLTTGIVAQESLFWVPFSGDINRILLEEAQLNSTWLSVGRLSSTTVHWK